MPGTSKAFAMRIRIAGLTITAIALAGIVSSGVAPVSAQVPVSPECLDPALVDDADFVDHIEALSNPSFCIRLDRFEENGLAWRIVTIRNLAQPGPLWAVPHDEEDAAFVSALYALEHYGGVAVVIENAGERLVGGFDPNHLFAADDASAKLCESVGSPAPRYVEAFLRDWNAAYPVIALHSNWDGYAGAGGLGTISINLNDDKMIPFPSAVAEGRFADEDTIAMLVGTVDPAASSNAEAAIDWFNRHGVHVIYRLVTPENNGCTLADYVTLNRLGSYINLEVEHGDASTQAVLIDKAMTFFASPAFRGMLGDAPIPDR